ncbi:phthiocerol/phthiodiolone dimycocerosyl transferase family protein [Fischerella sp. JS2]|uniref:phthiocerol/phthiodiolone dimycocerosyl transferase family protein n=1 Tax=Fischerella sp. JS2 TaxID=2597771 RepID=UPI0028F09394|nr:condensation domain-containing protein [Fischerella sp. JS2]
MNRLLGASEQTLSLLAQTKPINVVLCATITGAITTKQLNAALAWVQQRHPLLKVKVVDENSEHPRFVSEGVASIPLQVIERQGEGHWSVEVQEELSRPFSRTDDPLVRVMCLQSPSISELIVSFDHCIGDGLSGVYLLRDILYYLSELDINYLPQQRELPSCEELIPLKDTTDQLIGTRYPINQENSTIFEQKLSISQNSIDEKQNHLIYWYFLPEETAKLISYCRKEEISVHSILCASYLLAIANEMKLADDAILKCMSPINLRNYLLPQVGEDFGTYYTREVTYHQIRDTSNLCNVARDVKRQLKQVMASDKIFNHLLEVKAFLFNKPDALKLRQYLKGLIGSDLTVTNLGRLDFPVQFGSLHLQQLYITVAGIAPIIVGAVTLGGKMFVTCRNLEMIVPQAYAQRINQQAIQLLREVVITYHS